MNILWAVLILLGIGLVLGLGLAIAAKVLYVKEDERIDEVAKRLPNYNCGSCGYPGCKGLAEAIVKGKETSLRKCKPGKEDANFKPIIEYLDQHPNDDGTKVNVYLTSVLIWMLIKVFNNWLKVRFFFTRFTLL